MKKINLDDIRGKWVEVDEDTGHVCAGGDDTILSIKKVAEKVNEIVDYLNKKSK